MSCERFLQLLDAFLDERLSDVERRAAEEHLAGCAACTSLVHAVRDSMGALDAAAGADALVPVPADLAPGILARTSGPACGSAQPLLPELVDGELDPTRARLLALHLEHCARCAALRDTLVWLRSELPQMAALAPRPDLVPAILGATTKRNRAAGSRPRWEHLRAILRGWMARPQFAWEAAYAGTLALVLLFGTGISPWREVPSRALAVIQVDPRAAAATASSELRDLHGGVGAATSAAWDATAGRLTDRIRDAARSWAAERPGTLEAWGELDRHADDAWHGMRTRNFASASLAVSAMGQDLQALWRSARRSEPGPPPPSRSE
jgi:anti-sigma factor RsiW